MQKTILIKSIGCEKIFYFFVFLHIFIWTLIPTLLRHSLPMDALEGYVWGQHLQFGYDRNPWMNAWLTTLAVNIGGAWLVYLFSQISVAVCFFAVWKLGKKILNPLYVLVALLMLAGIQYYNIAAVDFNDNVLEIGLWALTIFYFYIACKNKKVLTWVLVGIFAALAMMTKYYTLLLLASMLVFLLITPEGRKNLTQPAIYCGVLVFLLISAPHCIWLFNHNLETINYALVRINDTTTDATIWHFTWIQLAAFLLPAFLFSLLWIGKNTEVISEKNALSNFDKKFLLLLAFGPYALTIIVAIIFKMTLHVMWGTPLLSLWSLVMIAYWQPQITKVKLYRFLTAVFLIFALFIGGYSYAIIYDGYGSSANYPAKDIANYIEQEWNKNHTNKITHVVGDRYTAGNFAYFAIPHPQVIVMDEHHPVALNNLPPGTIFIWRADKTEKIVLPKNVSFTATKDFYWQRNQDKLPLKIGFAFL